MPCGADPGRRREGQFYFAGRMIFLPCTDFQKYRRSHSQVGGGNNERLRGGGIQWTAPAQVAAFEPGRHSRNRPK
jgi:hypothetical protein